MEPLDIYIMSEQSRRQEEKAGYPNRPRLSSEQGKWRSSVETERKQVRRIAEEAFFDCDSDCDGLIPFEKLYPTLVLMFKRIGAEPPAEADIGYIFKRLEGKRMGVVSFKEFKRAALEMFGHASRRNGWYF